MSLLLLSATADAADAAETSVLLPNVTAAAAAEATSLVAAYN